MDIPSRWQQRLYFFSLAAVLFTTLFSWLNLNSFCIMLLVLSRLFSRPLASIKAAFADPVFLAFLAFFLVDAAGYLHTHDLAEQGNTVAKEATLVAIAYVGCSGGIGDARVYRRLLTWYYYMLLAASVYCLVMACREFVLSRDTSVFFYHSLTRPISQNAVFYSVYVVFGLLFLLSPGGEPVSDRISPMGKRLLRWFLVFFFMGMIVLLSSKLMLVIAVLFLANAFLRRYSYRKNKRAVLITGAAMLMAVGILALTNNPVSLRYRELAAGDLNIVSQKTFNPGMYFNALQLRLLEWRFGVEILNEQHAWLLGVSPGDSQDLLNAKYVSSRMYIGNPADGPHRHVHGFIGYNFHNQYLETLVRSGGVGLAALLAIFALLFVQAARRGTREAWFVILTIAVFFIPEAPLTMQHGVFLFCFFPLLALNGPGAARLQEE
jgi:O-antigen ligase